MKYETCFFLSNNLLSFDFIEWIKNVFLPTNTQRCKKAYKEATDVLEELEIPYYKGSAGIFIWADFSQVLFFRSFSDT